MKLLTDHTSTCCCSATPSSTTWYLSSYSLRGTHTKISIYQYEVAPVQVCIVYFCFLSLLSVQRIVGNMVSDTMCTWIDRQIQMN
ncbi:hypothetical protein BJX76DRAFT_334260 [Aspergillus varians]